MRNYRTAWHTTSRLHRSFHFRKRRVTQEDYIDPLTKSTPLDKSVLHVVSVPVGNLKDFTIRALDTLTDVDYIVTTDRASTKTLLDLVQVPCDGRMIHYSRTNRTATRAKLIEMLKGGRSMAFVTTSGTPCVGDVGSELVQAMHAHGVRVSAVPGASALLAALCMCGVTGSPHESHDDARPRVTGEQEEGHHFETDQRHGCGRKRNNKGSAWRADPSVAHDTDRAAVMNTATALQDGSFFFGNTLPQSHGARISLLRRIVAPATHPCVFYEVPQRLLLTLQDIAAVLPMRRVYISHELTKLNESLHVDTAERLVQYYLRHETSTLLRKGQAVIVIAGAGPREMAAWLAREAQRRRRVRGSVQSLMRASAKAAPVDAAVVNDSASSVMATKPCGAVDGARAAKRCTLSLARESARMRRLARQRRRRELLIRNIEREQERLRLLMHCNTRDAVSDT